VLFSSLFVNLKVVDQIAGLLLQREIWIVFTKKMLLSSYMLLIKLVLVTLDLPSKNMTALM
jgi:hypothetical protein